MRYGTRRRFTINPGVSCFRREKKKNDFSLNFIFCEVATFVKITTSYLGLCCPYLSSYLHFQICFKVSIFISHDNVTFTSFLSHFPFSNLEKITTPSRTILQGVLLSRLWHILGLLSPCTVQHSRVQDRCQDKGAGPLVGCWSFIAQLGPACHLSRGWLLAAFSLHEYNT